MSDKLTVGIIIRDEIDGDTWVEYDHEVADLIAYCEANGLAYERDDVTKAGWFYGIWVSQESANYILLTKSNRVELFTEYEDRWGHNLDKLESEVRWYANAEL